MNCPFQLLWFFRGMRSYTFLRKTSASKAFGPLHLTQMGTLTEDAFDKDVTFKAGDRIRTGDVQLGKRSQVTPGARRKSLRTRAIRRVYRRKTPLARRCEELREIAGNISNSRPLLRRLRRTTEG